MTDLSKDTEAERQEREKREKDSERDGVNFSSLEDFIAAWEKA